MHEAGEAVTPDFFVTVDCGLAVGATRREITHVPIYVTVPGRVRQETQQVGATSSGTPIYQTVTIQDPPTQELRGYDTPSREVQSVNKLLRLLAYAKDPADARQLPAPVWGVQALFESDDAGLKKVLPVLAAACRVFVGQETKGATLIPMRHTDSDVSSLRSGR